MHLLLVILYRHEEGELHDVEKYLWSLCLVCIFVVFYFIFFSAAFPWFSGLDYIALICEFCLLFLGDTLTLDSLPRLLIASNARISPRIIVTVCLLYVCPAILGFLPGYFWLYCCVCFQPVYFATLLISYTAVLDLWFLFGYDLHPQPPGRDGFEFSSNGWRIYMASHVDLLAWNPIVTAVGHISRLP